jgi:paraquat-inducible protein A
MDSLIACHECDLIHRIQPLAEGAVARCSRCGAVLYCHKRNSLDRTLAMTIAGLILFVLANSFPFLSMKIQAQVQESTLFTGIIELYAQGMWQVALLVLLTTILVPLIQLLGLLYVLLPIKLNRKPWKLALVFRFVQRLQPWSMMEVFMLGILVSIVKLAGMASMVPGISLFAFLVLIFILAASTASLDPHLIWEQVEFKR